MSGIWKIYGHLSEHDWWLNCFPPYPAEDTPVSTIMGEWALATVIMTTVYFFLEDTNVTGLLPHPHPQWTPMFPCTLDCYLLKPLCFTMHMLWNHLVHITMSTQAVHFMQEPHFSRLYYSILCSVSQKWHLTPIQHMVCSMSTIVLYTIHKVSWHALFFRDDAVSFLLSFVKRVIVSKKYFVW